VFHNFAKLIRKQRSLNLFQRTFSQLTLVLPGVILAERVLSGELEVGRAVQAAGAFTAVLGAVAVIVDNFESLSRFVAGIGRLQVLSNLVLPSAEPAEAAGKQVPRIELRAGEHLALEALTLYPPASDRVLIKELTLALKPGDALLITGDRGCGKSSLLRAIAGLWDTGSGVIQHPPLDSFFFLPQQRLRKRGATLISIAHRPAVLCHHTHVLHLLGEGAWATHEASEYRFDGPVPDLAAGASNPAPERVLRVVAGWQYSCPLFFRSCGLNPVRRCILGRRALLCEGGCHVPKRALYP
jgi:ABC-type uncharacterized transport system fused permease/ATPase subunit